MLSHCSLDQHVPRRCSGAPPAGAWLASNMGLPGCPQSDASNSCCLWLLQPRLNKLTPASARLDGLMLPAPACAGGVRAGHPQGRALEQPGRHHRQGGAGALCAAVLQAQHQPERAGPQQSPAGSGTASWQLTAAVYSALCCAHTGHELGPVRLSCQVTGIKESRSDCLA